MQRFTRTLLLATVAGAILAPCGTQAQGLLDRLKDRVKDTVERRAERKAGEATDNVLDSAECAAADKECAERAGQKVQGAKQEGKEANRSASLEPGQGAWANYDFKPGDRILFADDFSQDEIGDFPRRFEFRGGQVEIVEWNAGRWLRAAQGQFWIPLPQTLPERYTVEFDLAGDGNPMRLTFDGKEAHEATRYLELGKYFGRLRNELIDAQGEFGAGVKTDERPVHIAISVDGKHVKVYANETRVFNAPNGDLGRSNKIFVNMNGWRAEQPRLIANVRIAAGGKKLYDALAEKGRVATQGILFDTGSDRIRPESTPTLKEIGAMLEEHPDLELTIEGHTDNVGSADSNRTLSEKRAQEVRRHLIQAHGVDEARLQAKGYGASKPAATNDTPEGRQQNRRVELVKS
jgi:OmpA-OmpF porin, OOP family